MEKEWESLQRKKSSAKADCDNLRQETALLRASLESCKEETAEVFNRNRKLESLKSELERASSELEEALNVAEEQVIFQKQQLEDLVSMKDDETHRIVEECNELQSELFRINFQASKKGRLSDQSTNTGRCQTYSPKFRVIPRVRPSETTAVQIKGNVIKLNSVQTKVPKSFTFETVLGPSSTQFEVFQEIQEGIFRAVEGGRACIITYGHTGKTYTLNGIVSCTLLHIFNVKDANFTGLNIKCVEVELEQVNNLIEIQIESLISGQNVVESINSIKEIVLNSTNKTIILTVSLQGTSGVIQFVKYGGTDKRIHKLSPSENLKEYLDNNRAMTSLINAISAIKQKQANINYNNSILTQLIQPTLDKESFITVFLMVDGYHIPEAINTLSFGFKLTSQDSNVSLLEVERLERMALAQKIETLEKVYVSYSKTVNDKDCEIKHLNIKLKKMNRDCRMEIDKIKRELSANNHGLCEDNKRIRFLENRKASHTVKPYGSNRTLKQEIKRLIGYGTSRGRRRRF